MLAFGAVRAAHAGTSTAQNPTFTFDSPGVKQVTLTVCKPVGCSSVTKEVTVLDPSPAVASASALPPTVVKGELVELASAGTGKPPLTFTWRVVAAGGATVATLDGPTAEWNTATAAPGAYTVRLEVTNSSGSATSQLLPVVVLPHPLIFSDGFETGTLAWSSIVPSG